MYFSHEERGVTGRLRRADDNERDCEENKKHNIPYLVNGFYSVWPDILPEPVMLQPDDDAACRIIEGMP